MTFDAALRRAVVSELTQLADMRGSLPASVVRTMAEDVGCHPSTVWRWVTTSANGFQPASIVLPDSTANGHLLEELSDDHIDVVFQYQGDLAKAKRALDKVDPAIAAMSESTFRRRWEDVHPSIRAMAAEGAKGLRARQLRILYNCEDRNQIWHIDSMECPFWVLPVGHTTEWVKPWMITLEDDATRRIMAAGLTMGRPTADDVVVVLADGIRMKPLSRPGESVGGIPKILHSDNGAEFKNLVVTQGMKRLGVERKLTLPYHSHQNGKVERLQRTIQDELFKQLPGYSQGPESMSRKDPFGVESRMIGEEALSTLVFDYVEEYNSLRPHSSLGGRTPNQAWCEDNTPLQSADPEAIRLSLLEERRSYKVQQKGIHFRNVYYTAPELGYEGLVGSKVQVRYMPRDPSFIEVFYDGEWMCTAFPHANLTDSMREQIMKQVRAESSDARARQKSAAGKRRQAAAENPDLVIVSEPTGPPSGDMVADEEMLLELTASEEKDPDLELAGDATPIRGGEPDQESTGEESSE